MDKESFAQIRFNDEIIRQRILAAKLNHVSQCSKCNGVGFSYSDLGSVCYCSCMKKLIAEKNILLSGAPLEALDVLNIVSSNKRLKDLEFKQVMLSTDRHDIVEINRRKYLYKNLLLPYVNNANKALANGDSIVMFGTNGRGKTWSLYFLLVNLMDKYSVLFLTLKELYININTAYYGADNSREAAEHKRAALNMLNLIRGVDLLLLDEGSKLPKFNDNVSVQLEGMVKERIGNRRSVVFATNHSPGEFHQYFGPQVVSAFIKNVMSIHLISGDDLRHVAMRNTNSFSYLSNSK